MVWIGLRVTFGEVAAAARRTSLLVRGLLANYVLVPLATLLLLLLLRAEPAVAAGLLILAVCPGAPLGPPFTTLARGDVPLSVGLMVILGALSPLLSPALLALLLPPLTGSGRIEFRVLPILWTLLAGQLLPLLAGLCARRWAPRAAALLARPLGLAANALLVAAMALILATRYRALGAFGPTAAAGMVALLLAGLAIGWALGGPGAEGRRAMALTTSVRNAAVGLLVASGSFPGSPVATAVVAYGIVCIAGSFAAAPLLARIGR
jgi:BASS family bile acid:Na+ symporter